MHRGAGGRDDFFGFGDSFPNFRGLGRRRSLSSSFFGGRDPFDDPFFTDPFFTHPLRNIMGSSIFESSIFGPNRDPFGTATNFGFLEHQPLQQHRTSGPIIQEISDDDEDGDKKSEEHVKDTEKIFRSGAELYIKDPIEKSRGVKEHQQYQNALGIASGVQPQSSKYAYHSSTVTYGGINGAYYTSSKARMMGGDGVVVEESKEADASSGRATHRVSRGIHDKGHSCTRRLNSDGRVDTLQTLHNLNEDELPGFERQWKGNSGQPLMGWNPGMGRHEHEYMTYAIQGGNYNNGRRSSRVIDIEVLPSTTEQIDVSKKNGSKA